MTWNKSLILVAEGLIDEEAFVYRTVNSDVLGWVISRVTGKKVSAYLSERIWSKLGMVPMLPPIPVLFRRIMQWQDI